MSTEPIDGLIVLDRLRVQNANAISSPLTWGFPAPSAFTGFAHALERRLGAEGIALQIRGVGIVCHALQAQTLRPPGRYHHVFRLARHPVDKDGATAAIVEEGRAHLELSLVLAVVMARPPVNEAQERQLTTGVLQAAHAMRLAGGSLLPEPPDGRRPSARWYGWDSEDFDACTGTFRRIRRRLLPGFALVARDALLIEHWQHLRTAAEAAGQGEPTRLDALLDLCALQIAPQLDPQKERVEWESRRARPGWLVPLPVGYAALSELHPPGTVRNARDSGTPFRFVESVLSLGEWLNPCRLRGLDELLWCHDAQPEAGLYRVRNRYLPPPPITDHQQGATP